MNTNTISYKRICSIKLSVLESEEFGDYRKLIKKFAGEISKEMFKMTQTGFFQDYKSYKFYCEAPESAGGEYHYTGRGDKKKLKYPVPVKRLTQAEFEKLPAISKVINKYFPEGSDAQKGYVTGFIDQVARRYEGCMERNTKMPSRKIDPLRASIDFNKEQVNVNVDSGEVKIRSVFGKGKNTFYFDLVTNLNESFMGHLEDFKHEFADKYNAKTGFYEKLNATYIYRKGNRRELMFKITEYRNLEKADIFLGIDLNKNLENFIALSREVGGKKIYSKFIELTACEEKIRELENEVKDTIAAPNAEKIKGSSKRAKRTRLRRQVHSWQAKQLNIARAAVTELLNKFRNENSGKRIGIAIDTNTTGSKLGTYSHDVVRRALKEYADSQGVVYYEIPTAYTTMHHPECGAFDPKARGRIPEKFMHLKGDAKAYIETKYKNMYVCECGYEEHADIHAAKNIEIRAGVLQDLNVQMNNTWSGKVKIEYLSRLKEAGYSPNK